MDSERMHKPCYVKVERLLTVHHGVLAPYRHHVGETRRLRLESFKQLEALLEGKDFGERLREWTDPDWAGSVEPPQDHNTRTATSGGARTTHASAFTEQGGTQFAESEYGDDEINAYYYTGSNLASHGLSCSTKNQSWVQRLCNCLGWKRHLS
ncbi:hypothetical protein MMC10_000286 [Thelotrema lepadinum]|nr:hypothetical protein [Thelotrema lepadinum]